MKSVKDMSQQQLQNLSDEEMIRMLMSGDLAGEVAAAGAPQQQGQKQQNWGGNTWGGGGQKQQQQHNQGQKQQQGQQQNQNQQQNQSKKQKGGDWWGGNPSLSTANGPSFWSSDPNRMYGDLRVGAFIPTTPLETNQSFTVMVLGILFWVYSYVSTAFWLNGGPSGTLVPVDEATKSIVLPLGDWAIQLSPLALVGGLVWQVIVTTLQVQFRKNRRHIVYRAALTADVTPSFLGAWATVGWTVLNILLPLPWWLISPIAVLAAFSWRTLGMSWKGTFVVAGVLLAMQIVPGLTAVAAAVILIAVPNLLASAMAEVMIFKEK